MGPETTIAHTRKWVQDVVVGWNFCPFAKSVFYDQRLRYAVASTSDTAGVLEHFLAECRLLTDDTGIETTLLILPEGFADFSDYLELVVLVEQLLTLEGYDGVYQVASFHPDYLFAGAGPEDAANYTNRSPYPMVHLLREAALTEAIDTYSGDVEAIPETNIRHARLLGTEKLRDLLARSRA